MIHKINIKLTNEQIHDFCRSRYYVDDDMVSYPCQEYEGMDEEEIKDLIDEDIYALKDLLNITKEK